MAHMPLNRWKAAGPHCAYACSATSVSHRVVNRLPSASSSARSSR